MYSSLSQSDITKFGELLNNGWKSKKKFTKDVTNEYVDKLYNLEIKGDTNTFIVDNIVVSGLIEHVNKEVELKQI